MNKKGQAITLGSLPQVALILALIALITGAAAIAVTSFRDTTTASSGAYNITTQGLSSLTNLSTQMPTVGTIIGVVVIITVVIGAFAFGRGQGGGL